MASFDWDLPHRATIIFRTFNACHSRRPGTGTNFSQNGKIARLDGTNWTNGDAKAIWRPDGALKSHEISFGGHFDTYVLNNPTYATANLELRP